MLIFNQHSITGCHIIFALILLKLLCISKMMGHYVSCCMRLIIHTYTRTWPDKVKIKYQLQKASNVIDQNIYMCFAIDFVYVYLMAKH